jgi:sugar phosphate isomerase/epimerase
MRLKLYRSLWGTIREAPLAEGNRGFEECLRTFKALGYDGIEAPLLWAYECGKDKFNGLLAELDLDFVPMIITSGPVTPNAMGIPGHPTPGNATNQHIACFEAQVKDAFEGGWNNVAFVNSHSLNDFSDHRESKAFFTRAAELKRECGYEIHHETHRKRLLHSPWVCRDFCSDFSVEDLTLTADFSHFTTVAECPPTDPDLNSLVEMLVPRVEHVHARVGFDHGPQVSDPRVQQWEPYVLGFEAWWEKVWEDHAERGRKTTTMTMEYGPPNYQQTDPKTGLPVADIWDVNHWQALRLRQRFAELYGEERTASVVPSETQGWPVEASLVEEVNVA